MTVILYARATCPWSEKLLAWLQKHKIAFELRDVAESETARDDLLEKSGQLATPMLDSDGKIIIGFDEKQIGELFKKQK